MVRVNLLVVLVGKRDSCPRATAPLVDTTFYHCEHQRDGFIWHRIEYVGEYDAITGAVIEPDYVDSLLDDAVAIW